MNKTRFQMPPRADTAIGIDHWVTGEAASRRAGMRLAYPSPEPVEAPVSVTFPFMFDWAGLLAAHQRNIEAIAAANRVVTEGVQAMARRNIEMMQAAIDAFSERVQTMGNPQHPGDRAMQQTETAIKAYEDAAAHLREMREMLQDTGTEAMEVLGKRYNEAANELKSLARCATGRFWDSETKPATLWELS